MKMKWDERCSYSTPSGDKLFVINSPFTMKQYKVDNIANFVITGKLECVTPLRPVFMGKSHPLRVVVPVVIKNYVTHI